MHFRQIPAELKLEVKWMMVNMRGALERNYADVGLSRGMNWKR